MIAGRSPCRSPHVHGVRAAGAGSARYDSLQIKGETKTRGGLYALLSYTYARALDNGFSDGVGTSTGATYYPLPGTAKDHAATAPRPPGRAR